MEKRKSAYMRFGRSIPDFDNQLTMDKRKSAYMRSASFFQINILVC
uniref:Uncharacterized protein n=1 Tax=Angiostrongylus cantonensis TaxID=6313 RepID=A0A0K0D9D0_ANGCA